MSDKPTCGRCGTYRHLHPTARCQKPRLSFWWDRHFFGRHILGTLWLRLGDKQRFRIVDWYFTRRPQLCWCELVDAYLLDFKKDDYEDACDVPLWFDASEPTGGCYCPPAYRADQNVQ